MAESEDYGGDNLSSLDVTTVDEGTVVELLRRRYAHDKIYVSSLNLFEFAFQFPKSCAILSALLFCRVEKLFDQICLFADGRRRYFAVSESI